MSGRYDAIEAEASFAQEMKSRALKAESERDELREAARALLTGLSDWSQCSCSYAGCPHLATRYADEWLACDEHSEWLDGIGIGRRGKGRGELCFAPALRRLRALVEEKP